MLNIELQCCGLAMLVVLVLLFVREKSLDISSRRLFFRALLACVICLTLDILSIVAIYLATYHDFSPLITKIVCKLYVVSLVGQAFNGFIYSAGEFFSARSHKMLRLGFTIWAGISCILILILPIEYLMEDKVVYSYGASTIATYVAVIVLLIATIVMAFIGADYSSKRRRRAILLWQGMWLVAAIVQMIFPNLLLVGFAAAYGMVLIYAELENPHEGIDRMTGQYTANALLAYIRDRYDRFKSFSSMHIKVEYRTQNVDMDTEKTVMLRISNYLNKRRDAFVFRESDDSFVVVYKNAAQMNADHDHLSVHKDEIVSIPVEFKYILMPNSRIITTADEYFHFHHYLEGAANEKGCVIANRTTAEEFRKYSEVKEMVKTALDEKRVEVFYQPIYNVAKRKFTAAEALVRIRDRDGTIIQPNRFIPVAEECGLITPLGNEVLRQVCELLYSGLAQKLGIEYIEVNFSVAQFDNENPASIVKEIVDEFKIEPRLLNLEITETASNSAKQVILKNMNKLIEMGVKFSLDDFGTGRSNLDYFVDMPVEIIKFDYTFTQGYFRSNKAKYVMESVVNIMHKMGLAIVSEGVETTEQLAAMCNLGVNYIQGFYYSRPIPKAEFLKFLEAKNFNG
ncbi:MAG: EAL domain-containing protein [Lachnospiraceae bacterium]|nr:EAL domain-containing protein [Lachnospiraceae bacterium]